MGKFILLTADCCSHNYEFDLNIPTEKNQMQLPSTALLNIQDVNNTVHNTGLTWVRWSDTGLPGPADFLWYQHLHRVGEATDLCRNLHQSGLIHPRASLSPHAEPLRAGKGMGNLNFTINKPLHEGTSVNESEANLPTELKMQS